jgi:transposase-like protein
MSRRRYTEDEKTEFLAEFDRHGGSAAAFCREHGLVYQTFMTWCRRPTADLVESAHTPEFVEVELEAPRRDRRDYGSLVELELGAGMILRIRPPHDQRP